MKVLTIGDLHGLSCWKQVCFGDYNNYKRWEDGLVSDESGAPFLYTEYDYIVFVGDYVDSFEESNVSILHNLKEIIKFQKSNPPRIILLAGNHDICYMFPQGMFRASGYRSEMYHDLSALFETGHFQAAFQLGNCLWTHAGLTTGCLHSMKTVVERSDYRFKELVPQDGTLAELINFHFDSLLPELFNVSMSRGGTWFPREAGIFWADRKDLLNCHVENLNQVVGHTHKWALEEVVKETCTLYFVDAIGKTRSEFLVLEFDESLKIISKEFLIVNII